MKDEPASGKKHLGIILAIFLLGLLIGGLYVGMLAPVRTVIQEQFGVGDETGIWIINIYTLFYAALIPVIGNLADRYGRKLIFAVCIVVFAVGALMCGISVQVGGFALMLVGRVVQAVGACGMIPVANAEIGTTFPEEKRGMALGIAAAVGGMANIIGAAAGSLILGFIGNENWPMLFFGCIPICIVLCIAALVFLENSTAPVKGKLDIAGSVLFVAVVLLLLLGIRSLDFFDFIGTITQMECWLPFVGAIACAVVFRVVERRAADPIFHMDYLHNKPIVITMLVSFFIGCIMISMMIVPEFAEKITGSQTGSGGYYMAALGIFSLIGPIVGGRLIDKRGPKPVLIGGFLVMIVGYLFLAFVGVAYPAPPVLVAGLAVIGLGLGFAMGAPTNYMILENTSTEESTSAIATITLVRQVGTSLAPAIYVGFITSYAGYFGYQCMMIAVAVSCVIGAIIMLFYRSPKIGKK